MEWLKGQTARNFLWYEVVRTATYLINSMPSRVTSMKSLCELILKNRFFLFLQNYLNALALLEIAGHQRANWTLELWNVSSLGILLDKEVTSAGVIWNGRHLLA
jgi:hypothetical protein